MGRQIWFQFQRSSSAELGICWRPVLGSAYGGNSAKRPPWKCWICSGFLRWIFWSQKYKEKSAEKIRRKIRNKKSASARPPRNPPARPKIRHKTYQQIRLSNLQVHARFFRLRRIALGASSEDEFWDTVWLPSGHGRGSHVEMHLQSLSCCCWDGQGLLRTLPDNTFSKSVRLRKRPKNNKKNIRHATLLPLAAQAILFKHSDTAERS